MNTSMTLLEHIEKWCTLTPDAIAIITQHEELTYRQLAQYSHSVANYLRSKSIGVGNIVPIEAVRSADFVVGLLGIMKSGAAYSPIDHTYPQKRKTFIVEQTLAPLMLTSIPEIPEVSENQTTHTVSIASLRADNLPESSYYPHPKDPIYVIFTSGTTGVPKGVIVEHHSVESFVSWHNKQFGVNQNTRSTLIAALGFDVAHWEIWSPLIAGGTLYMLSDETRRDIDLLVKSLDHAEITHAFVPTVMARDFIEASRPSPKALKYLFTGGEKLNPINTDHIDYQFVDYYGPTEASIWATWHLVPSSTLNFPSSIGKPRDGATIYILDDQLNERPIGQVGEIFIAGPCLARGYLNNERQTHEKFLLHSIKGETRIYRTGDLGKYLPDGSIQFLGRTDEQIKIRGHLVELSEIETIIARQSGVKKVSVIAPLSKSDGSKEVVAFLILHESVRSDDNIINRIRQGISAFLPDYMMPSQYLVIDSFPENANGKTDKTILRERFEQHRTATPIYDFSQIDDKTERTIFEVFAQTLGHTDFDQTRSFFDVGGHSLLAAKVVVLLSKNFDLSLRITDLYNHPSVLQLTNEIKRRVVSPDEISDQTSIVTLRTDAVLPDDIIFAGTFDVKRLKQTQNIFLTGVTGLIGVHLLAELLTRTTACVHCIVRAQSGHEALNRLKEKINQYKVPITLASLSRVKLYTGDISEPQLGLSTEDYNYLSAEVDVIYHSASAVNFIKPYSLMKKNNLDGMIELVRFAAAKQTKAMMLLSTISVYSWGYWITGKKVMSEDDDIDQNLPAISADIGYVKSKWAMEQIANQAEARGMPLMTFRLGYATYHSKTGMSASYQWWGRLVKTCMTLGAIPDLKELREGLSTIDYMSESVAHISQNSAALGKKFNLIHSKERNISLQDFFVRIEKLFGHKFTILPFKEWRSLWENDVNAPLYPVLNLFKDPMHEGKCILELYQHTYDWERNNVEEFLEGSNIRQPEFDEIELKRYLIHSIDELPTWRRA